MAEGDGQILGGRQGAVASIRHYRAGNRHGRLPVSVARVFVPRQALPDQAILAAIKGAVPALKLPAAVDVGPGDGAAFGAIVGTLASELLRLAYEPAGGHQVLGAADPSTIDLLLIAHRPVVGARALALALDLLGARQAGPPADAVAAFLDWAKPIQLHDQDAHLADVAAVRGIPWRASPLGQGPLLLGEGARLRRTFANLTDRTSFLGVDICSSKWVTSRTLRAAGLPSPGQRRAASVEEAQRAAAALGYPVVLKPANASRGVGICCDLGSPAEVAEAFPRARQHGPVIVETFAKGDDYRLLVVGGRYFSTLRRRAAAVVADGSSTVAALVAAENLRRADPASNPTGAHLLPLPLDAEADRLLRRQGFDRQSVAPAGTEVRLRSVANWSQGGTFDYPTAVHPTNIRLAERVAALMGMDVVGVDLICQDLTRPFHETGAIIHEVQRQPTSGLRNVGVYERMMDHVLPAGTPVRIPIVGVVGPAAGAVVAAVAAELGALGLRVGVAGKGGLRVGRLARSADDRRPDGLALLVDDPSVDAAVVELDPHHLIERGLGHCRLDVAVLTGGETPADVARLLAGVADRGLVCAATDHRATAAAGQAGVALVAVPGADGTTLAAAALGLLDLSPVAS